MTTQGQFKHIELSRDKLIEDYAQVGNVNELAKRYNVPKTTLRSYFERYQIPIKRWRKYPFNESLFEADTPESFYIAGFIAADAYCRNRGNQQYMNLLLGEKDLPFLLKLKQHISPTTPVYKRLNEGSKRDPRYKDTVGYSFRIGSQLLIEQLSRFGIHQNKSLTLEFPEYISTHLLAHHFVRGYFDGDGSISIPRSHHSWQRTTQKQIHIRGTEQFLCEINSLLSQECSKVRIDKKISKDSGIYSLQYNGNNIAKQIGDYLYRDASIYLERKRIIFDAVPQVIMR